MRTPTFLAALAALSTATATAAAQAPARVTVRAENPLDAARADETLALPWAELARRLPGLRADRVRVRDAEGRELVSQPIDEDGDGTLDALLVLADFAPREVRTLAVEPVAPEKPYAPRVHVRHDDPRDDVAWESDRVGFRIYGEGLKKTPSAMSSSGIDVWPKRTRALIVEKWYAKGHDAYHLDTGEGADFYDVGQTLGTGGTALWVGDSLARADNFKAWKIVANGPIRAVFELRYDPWGTDALRVTEVKRVAIDAGQQLYRQESTFRVAGGAAPAGGIPYAIGLVKRPGMVGTASRANAWAWLTGWGPVARKNGGHGELGTAVLLPRDRVTDWKETDTHYLAISRAAPGVPVVHWIGAGWTASGDFPTPQSWWSYLDAHAQRLAAPVRVTLGDAAAAPTRAAHR